MATQETNEMNATIVVMCGLPGAGKSTLCKQLVDNNKDLKIVYISYDNYLNDLISKNDCKFDSQLWHESRNKAWQKTIDTLEKYKKTQDCDKEQILLIDDNFEYQSMRYRFYQIARQYQIGFLIIYIKCDIKTCIQRNMKRKGFSQVSQNIILKMDKKFEQPNALKNKWESNTLMIENDDNNSIDEIESTLLKRIMKSFECVPLPIETDNNENKEKQRQINQSNLRHCVDEQLRKRVNSWITYCKEYIVNENKKQGEEKDSSDTKQKELNLASIAKNLNLMKKQLFKTVDKADIQDDEHLKMLIRQYDQDFDDMISQYWLVVSGNTTTPE